MSEARNPVVNPPTISLHIERVMSRPTVFIETTGSIVDRSFGTIDDKKEICASDWYYVHPERENYMKFRMIFAAIVLLIFAGLNAAASAGESQKDSKALDVLNAMAAYTGSVDQFAIKGEVFADARLDAGLIVSNPTEIVIKIDRPGSLFLQSFDGLNTKKIYIHKGKLTLFNTETNFFAQAQVPEAIKEAMQFAIDEFDLEMPLAELLFANSAIALLTGQDTVLYLTDKSRVSGVDCHHIAIRGKEIDLQLWVEEGEQPTVRKMSMSMKWEGGSPRTIALMNLSKTDGLDSKTFEFKPPEGAQEIRFFGSE